jgi:aryl-alcohol dehydrogenase-like predicted oxidoreductase
MRLTGRVPFGVGSPDDRDQAIRVLRRAVEVGVDHIDTAAFYRSNLHCSNELIRASLSPYPDGLLIATKVKSDPDHGGSTLRDQVEENLGVLGLECLGLVYLRVLPGTPVAEDFAVLADMRDAGLIRHLGLSGVTEQQLDEALAVAPVAAVQNRYGVGVRRDETVLHATASRGIAFVPFFSIAAEGKHDGPPAQDRAAVIAIAAAHRASPAMIRIAWTLELGPHVLAIPGTSNLQHLEDNVSAGQLQLSTEEVAALRALSVEPPT